LVLMVWCDVEARWAWSVVVSKVTVGQVLVRRCVAKETLWDVGGSH
jgi:hypothetical protein